MKVYVLLVHRNYCGEYEGSEILSIHRDKDEAKTAKVKADDGAYEARVRSDYQDEDPESERYIDRKARGLPEITITGHWSSDEEGRRYETWSHTEIQEHELV